MATDSRLIKTGGDCEQCKNNSICKHITEMTQIEAEFSTTLGKHTNLVELKLGMVCNKYQ